MGVALIATAGCVDHRPPPPPPPAAALTLPAPSLTQAQLDQLVAPVALYADPLLVDILTASTYPLEIVEAQRWVADPAHAALKGDALAAALDGQPWDPSIKALIPFPQILQMMNDHLDWTQHLGEAFLAQQADVMDSVQRLRQRAQTAGTLKSSPQQNVVSDGSVVTILPPPAEVIYLPAYDPWCAFGPWPYSPVPPYYFAPWPGYCAPGPYAIEFGFGFAWPFAYWEWGVFDWRGHDIRIRHDHWDHFHPGHGPSGDVWRHDPAHRGNVPYRDPRNSRQFQPGRDYHQSFRGYEGRDGAIGATEHRGPPAFGNIGPGRDIRAQSQRGQFSRQGMSGRAAGGGARPR